MKILARTLMAQFAAALALFATSGAGAGTVATTVWRGETAYVDIPDGCGDRGQPLSRNGVSVAFGYYDDVAYEMQPGGVDMRIRPDVYREIPVGGTGAKKPTVCRITASANAKPGKYRFGALDVIVVDRVLPPASEWKYFLDLWQHPWAVSRYFNVKPFSKEHYAKMKPIWTALAECGCKALTVTLLDLPWNHQCHDAYHSMIGRVKKADGSWTFDYALFDEYVAFGRMCGLGPDIACYTMCPWGYMATWKDANGTDRREKLLPGTPTFEDYWGPFLIDFAAHLKAKGWFDAAYIAMDERGPEDVRKIADLIQRKAPGLKIAMAGKSKPSAFDGIKIENYSQNLIRLHKEFIPELAPRRQKGLKTTFYVCCSARHPNTFMESPADEGFWLGAYPVMVGFDGFLRWAANSWPENPYKDASFRTKSWKAGDTFLIYPGGELSSRLISLRAGVVAAEKLRLLKEAGVASDRDIARLAAPYGYRGAVYNGFDFSAFRREVESFVNAGTPAAQPRKSSETETTFKAMSPDGLNEIRLDVSPKGGMSYSVWRKGKTVVAPTGISMAVRGRGWLNGTGAAPKATRRTVRGKVATPRYKKAEVDLAGNETRVDFGDWSVALHARDDGVAWRFETRFPDEITVTAENAGVCFPKGAELCYTQADGFMSGWEKPAKIGPVASVSAGHPQIVMTPFTATVPDAGVVCVTESNLLDYPGLNFYRRGNEPDTLRSWQAGVPKEVEKGRRKIKVKSRQPYLARTKGSRVFPWRVFVLGDTPSDLVPSDAVYALAEPSRIGDAPWVRPGQVAWDWWNGFRITDVPGLETGCNYATYKAYVDFAAANGIAYIIMDEGWSEKLDLDRPRDAVNVPGVIAYAREKGVGVILWAAWSPLADREVRRRVFDRYAAMGAKGFKIDFMERDDQDCERFLEDAAADAAERRLVVLYHGIHKPTGLCRTYPNVLNYEGVYGLEQGHSIGGRKVVVSNDVNIAYTRMLAGALDYTPGAMRNRAFDAPPFDKKKDAPACYGTRCHQLALFPLFEAPVQMLCDSPTQYRTAPECTAFIKDVPTVWDETVGVAGEIGRSAAVARRKGNAWWLGAISNWDARDLELPTGFLARGKWKVEVFEDAPDADVNAEHYVRRTFTITAGEPIKAHLARGGGFAAHFTRAAD